MSEPHDQPTRKSDGPPVPPFDGETLDAPPPPEPGTVTAGTHSHIGEPPTASVPRPGAPEGPISDPPGYVVVRELGSGGMGVVYEARQTKLNRMVALKVLKSGRTDTQSTVRFRKEAEAVAEIKHPNVVQVFDVGQYIDGPYMALELLTGGTLSDRLREHGRFEPRRAAELLIKIAGAVQAAHDLGIVHRDLKPGNVLFDNASEPKVTDFGLAKRTGGADLTHTQALMGTPAYMAPEQARGETRFVGAPADVWALGAILYECLTGKRAFDADDTWAVLRKVTDEPPPAPRTHVPGLPRDLELIALKCLEKVPADRYPSAAALAADLENFLTGRPVSVRPAGPIERTVKWTKRNPAVAALTACAALALVVGSAVSLAFGLEAQKQSEKVKTANDELSRTNDDLTKSQAELTDTNKLLTVVSERAFESLNKLIKTRDDLELAEGEARAKRIESEERGYLSDIALAHQLWKANDLRGMRAALERCPPNRRRWEWYYLDRISRPEKEAIPTDSLALALAYSPDGKWLADFTRAGTLTVRDRATGRVSSYTVDRPTEMNPNIAFHPNGKELAFSIDKRVWTATLDPWGVKELAARPEVGKPLFATNVLALGYTKDGQLLCAEAPHPDLDAEWVFLIRDVRTGKTVGTLKSGVKSPVTVGIEPAGCVFGSDGTRFAAAIIDSGFRVAFAGQHDKEPPFAPVALVWDTASEKLLGKTEGGIRFGQLAFDPHDRKVGYGRRGFVGELDSSVGVTTRTFGGHTGEVLTVAFDKNNLIWSGGEDKLVRAHDRITGAERYVLRGCSNTIYRVAVSPDGKEVAAVFGDIIGGAGTIHRFDVTALDANVWRAPVSRNRMNLTGAVSHDGTKFAVWDFSQGGEKQSGPRLSIREVGGATERTFDTVHWPGVAFRPDGGFVLLEGNDHIARKEWLRFIGPDGKEEGRVDVVEHARLEPRSVFAGTADGRTVAAVTPIRFPVEPGERQPIAARFAVWNGFTRAPGKTAEFDLSRVVPRNAGADSLYPTAAVFDATGQKLAATFVVMWNKERGGTESRGVTIVWDTATGAELFRQFTLDPMRAVCFAPEVPSARPEGFGTVITAGGSATGGIVYGWNIDTGERTFVMHGHTRAIVAVAVGPHGRLATGGADRMVKVWDVSSRREILTLDGFARHVTHVAFTADGKNLVTATGFDQFDTLTSTTAVTDAPPAEVRVFRGPK